MLRYFDRKNKLGFTLVEAVLIIGIMAILVAALTPALISYVERSRAQEDLSSVNEIVKSVNIALEDKDVYGEMYDYCFDNNFITYSDSTGTYGSQETDFEYYAPDGSGRGVTITFNPEGGKYIIKNGIVNDMTYGNGSVGPTRNASGAVKSGAIQCYLSECNDNGYLYKKLATMLGEEVEITSATYRNSSLTIFIQIEDTTDNVKIAVSGAFNGTNLSDSSLAAIGTNTICVQRR